jgi:hypothetical protein
MKLPSPQLLGTKLLSQNPSSSPRRRRSKLVFETPTKMQQLKEKFLLNFQGFQVELSTEEDFLSCAQFEKETLPNFYRRFLQLKAQAPKVSGDQVITQAIKALCIRSMHNHLVKE